MTNEQTRIVARLNGRTQMEAFEAAKAIWENSETSLERPLITTLMSGRRPFNRAAAAYAMQLLKTPKIIKALERAVKNKTEHPRVRGEAAEALAHGHRKKSHDVLLKGLGDRSKDLRFWCAFGLGPGGELRVSNRDDLPGDRSGREGNGGADPFRGPGAGDLKDVDLHRRGGFGARHLVGPEASRRPAWRRRQDGACRGPVAFGAVSKGGTRAAAGGSMAPIDAGAGPVVVLVHGQPGAGGDWAALADLLSGDHRVLAPDRPGWGSDGRAAMGIAANADVLEELLEAAGAESPVTVVGHSLGGGVALELALKHPERVGALGLVGSVGVAGSLSGFDRL